LAEYLEGHVGEHPEVCVVMPGVDAGYEELLVRSDLMVTDFSGVQYDFAYMGKPVVYFHPDELPSQYGHGAMNFETMGFGEVVRTVEQAADILCDYMRRDCTIEPRFAARIDDFFEYRDDHNCARILADYVEYVAREEVH
jgi:CDP-glycerol glycerophosphotransferase (TagB/SpsB family)